MLISGFVVLGVSVWFSEEGLCDLGSMSRIRLNCLRAGDLGFML